MEHIPFSPKFLPPLENLVSLIKLDPNRLHNSPFDISQSSMTQVEIDPGDVTPAASVKQTQQSIKARSELEPLLITDNNKTETRVNTNSETRVNTNTDYKKGRNVIKAIALTLFLITLIITSHVIRNKMTGNIGNDQTVNCF